MSLPRKELVTLVGGQRLQLHEVEPTGEANDDPSTSTGYDRHGRGREGRDLTTWT